MSNCRLFIVEGLPCSGKSSASKFIAEELAKQGKNVKFFDEGQGSHPADYEFSAFIPESRLCEFSAEEQTALKSHSELRCGGFVVQLGALQGELFEKALRFKIYDMLDWETEMPVMLDRWHSFGQSVRDDEIYVFNCCFLQNPMCETMMRFNFPARRSAEYIGRIYEEIRHLNPRVIYMERSDLAEAVRNALPERGEDWLNAVIDYHVNGAFGKSMGLEGFNGYIECLSERKKREVDILKTLNIPSLFCYVQKNGWDEAYKSILSFISEEL